MAKSLGPAWPWLLVVSITATLACDANLGAIADAGTDSDSGEAAETNGTELFECIGGELCPDGSSCSNSVCVAECSNDEACASDEWCADNLCQPDVVPSCKDDDDCIGAQVCLSLVCVTIGESPCNVGEPFLDGCPSNAICYEDFDQEVGYCHQLPACGDDGSCPIGVIGAVCNLDTLPNKDQICLLGLCDTVAHCPEEWSCVRYTGDPLGTCSDGTFGSVCSSPDHCLSGTCTPIPGVGGGFCQ